MEYQKLHEWPSDSCEAYAIQAKFAAKVTLSTVTAQPRFIAFVDTAYGYDGSVLYAAAVIVSFPEMEQVERAFWFGSITFPYVPGLLYFREGPVVVEALARLRHEADLILVSAHGTAHPRLCGMACQIGVLFDRATIGCSRKLLCGDHRPVGESRGSYQVIMLHGREVGVAYRSRDNVKPIFISPGNKCDLEYAKKIVVGCLRGFRLPEPIRLAHALANRYQSRTEREQSGTYERNFS